MSLVGGWRAGARALAALCLVLGVAIAGESRAQTVGAAQPSVPSVKILRGTLVTPGSNFLDNQSDATATDGLCRDYGANADICPAGSTGVHPRAPEIKELARGLKNDPDLIYEFVRNSVDTEFMFGAHKGALGVIIDHSGTAFDQAELMVELLRESGFTARYRFGTLTLTKDQFAAWTGISQAKAACDFLALGGIPATVGGGCTSTADISTAGVVMDHVWVEADIGGQTYFFDPSYKPYEFKAGANVRTMMGFTADSAITAAATSVTGEQTGSIAGTTYVDSVNGSQVSTTLSGLASTLVSNIRSASPDLGGASMTDLVGGRIIEPATRPTGGWRQTTPSNYSATRSWTAVPDLYRARLKLNAGIAASGSTPAKTFVSADFFADEVYGRRIIIRSSPDTGDASTAVTWSPELWLDGVKVRTGDSIYGPVGMLIRLGIQADHPFAADSGTYGDAKDNGGGVDNTVYKTVDVLQPAVVVAGWGLTSSALAAKWDSEQVTDSSGYMLMTSVVSEGSSATPRSGDKLRAGIAASWLGQYTAAGELNAQLAGARLTTLHTLGVVSADERVVGIPQAPGQVWLTSYGFTVYDEATVVDLETSLGLVSKTSDADARRGGIRAIALTASVLEGSVVAQTADTPDAASAATRMAWGNAPESGETRSTAPRRVYRLAPPTTAYTFAGVKALTLYDGGTTAPLADGPVPAIPQSTVDFMESRLANTILAYSQAGFDVVASSESSLGPGHRVGSSYAIFTAEVFGNGTTYSGVDYAACAAAAANDYQMGAWNSTVCPQNLNTFSDVAVLDAGSDTYTVTAYSRFPTNQRGGAIAAVKYESGTSDPEQIAYVVTRLGLMSKGGGGPTVSQASAFNPGDTPETLKSRFADRSANSQVDPSSGQAGFVTPVLASVGYGEFPSRLESRGELRGGGAPVSPNDGVTYFPSTGIVSNWRIRADIGSSGYEALGQGRIEAAAPAIVAFVALQDLWKGGQKSAQRELTGAVVGDWWAKQVRFNVVTVDQGASSTQYVRLPDGSYVPAGGGSAKLTMTGTPELVRPPKVQYQDRNPQQESTFRAWKYSSISLSLTSAQGDTQTFAYTGTPPLFGDGYSYEPTVMAAQIDEFHYWLLSGWSFPNGVALTVTYPFSSGTYNIQVASNLGYTLTIVPPGGVACGAVASFTDELGASTKIDVYAAATRSVTQRPSTTCLLKSVYDRTDGTTAALSYVYDSLGRVKEARDGVAIRTPSARGPNLFYFAPGYRFERADPLGGTYSAETLRNGRRSRITDELGRVVTSDFDGRGRLLTRTYPEGDQEVFTYDVRGNPLTLTKVPKPGGTPPPSLTSSMTYVEGPTTWVCSNLVTCNKPSSADGPRTDVTDVTNFTWDSTTGLLTQVLKPADGSGVRPQIDFAYTLYGSAIWLPTSRTEKINGTAGNTTITTFEYDPANHYLMTYSIVDPSGLNLKTCYAYDSSSNINAVTNPLAASCPVP